MKGRQNEIHRFWTLYAPLTGASSVLMWMLWGLLVGNTWPAWAAAVLPIGGAVYLYPWTITIDETEPADEQV